MAGKIEDGPGIFHGRECACEVCIDHRRFLAEEAPRDAPFAPGLFTVRPEPQGAFLFFGSFDR